MTRARPSEFPVDGATITLALGDITDEATDAIVNAANSSLLGGGGVDGAIHRAAGPKLLEACRALRATSLPNGLPTGRAVITPGFGLRARYVIHTVGPVFAREGADAARLLASCYTESIILCCAKGLGSVAFPSISTGAFGYPPRRAAPVALRAVRDAVAASGPAYVKFVLFDDETFETYSAAARAAR